MKNLLDEDLEKALIHIDELNEQIIQLQEQRQAYADQKLKAERNKVFDESIAFIRALELKEDTDEGLMVIQKCCRGLELLKIKQP